jgi:hypothetical protein
MRIRWTDEEAAKVVAEYKRILATNPDKGKFDAAGESMLILAGDRRRTNNLTTASFISRMAKGAGTHPAIPCREGQKRKTETVCPPPIPQSSNELTIDDAVAFLCDVIVARVSAEVEKKLQPMIAARIGAAAVKLAPMNTGRDACATNPKNLREMDALQLRYELIKAKAEADTFRVQKIVAELSRRESAANVITRESQDES